MLSKETRETYYSMVREVMDFRAKYVRGLLDELQKDHQEAREKDDAAGVIFDRMGKSGKE